MISKRPYLLHAYYDWILANNMTPHLVVKASHKDAVVPQAYVKDGQIVLNISPSAIKSFFMDYEHVTFNARFGGSPFQVYLPVLSIAGIFARENGDGIILEGVDGAEFETEVAMANEADIEHKKPALSSVTAESSEKSSSEIDSADAPETDSEREKKVRPSLTVVK